MKKFVFYKDKLVMQKKGRQQRRSAVSNIAPIAMESPERIAPKRLLRGLGMESGTQSKCEPISSASNKNILFYRLATILMFAFLSVQFICGQCYPDRHSTNANDGWISCSETPNPNNTLGNSHWVLYNLGQNRNLYKTTFWNSNHPNHLAWGVKQMPG